MITESLNPPSSLSQSFPFRWLQGNRWFALAVILPVVLATVYYGLVASDIYVSQSRFVVKNPAARPAQSTSLANVLQTTTMSAGQEQARETMDYIQSRDALMALQQRIDLRGRYTRAGADVLSRFPGLAQRDTFENLFRFYTRMIDAQIDPDSGLVVLEVRGFTPVDAHDVNASLLDLGEGFINRLNERARRKTIAEAETRLAAAGERLHQARLAVGAYRSAASVYDPNRQANGTLDIANRLIAEQAALQAQLDLTLKAAPANPAIPGLRSRIAAIGREVAAQTGRIAGADGAIASKVSGYDRVALEQEFATQNFTAASVALEQARVDAQRQQFYLERVVDPNQPDMPALPHRLRQILTVAAAALCLYFIFWMLIVGILEHAPED